MDVLQLFFGFQGRINRARYWLCGAVLFVLTLVLALVQYGLTVTAGDIIAGAMGIVVSLVMIFSGFALGAKRLHDRDRSGWWQLFKFIPILLAIPAALIGNALLVLMAVAFGMTIAIWLFVELGCLRGTIGLNRFGPDPLEQGAKPSI